MSVGILSNDLESSQDALCCEICEFIFLLACTYFRFITAVTHYRTVSHSSDNVTISGNFTNCCVITNTPNYQVESIGFLNTFVECIPFTCHPVPGKYDLIYLVLSSLLRRPSVQTDHSGPTDPTLDTLSTGPQSRKYSHFLRSKRSANT